VSASSSACTSCARDGRGSPVSARAAPLVRSLTRLTRHFSCGEVTRVSARRSLCGMSAPCLLRVRYRSYPPLSPHVSLSANQLSVWWILRTCNPAYQSPSKKGGGEFEREFTERVTGEERCHKWEDSSGQRSKRKRKTKVGCLLVRRTCGGQS